MTIHTATTSSLRCTSPTHRSAQGILHLKVQPQVCHVSAQRAQQLQVAVQCGVCGSQVLRRLRALAQQQAPGGAGQAEARKGAALQGKTGEMEL
jgi:hypothetical protein